MSNEFDANALKTPLGAALIRTAAGQAQHAQDQVGKRWPCTVSAVIGSGIVEVNFEVTGTPYVLNKQKVPIAYSEYVRYPIQVGDRGFCGAADLRLGQMTGQGGGAPQVGDRPGNLTGLMFYWLGNANWTAPIDPDAVEVYGVGSSGVILRDGKNTVVLTLTSDGLTIATNGMPVTVSGGGDVTVTDGGDVVAAGISLTNHTHSDVESGSDDTGPPVAS